MFTVDQNGCQDIDDVLVTVNTIPNADLGPDISICEGESITLTASDGISYLWSTGETSQSVNVNPNQSTTYSVTINNNGCSDSDDILINVNPIPTANAGPDQNITAGASAILTANGGGTYLWSTGETTQSITVSPANTTAYTVTVNTNGCEDNDTVLVIVDGQVIADAGLDVTICEGENTILTATGGDTYQWSTGETTESITVNPSQTTTYSVTVFLGGGSDTDEVTVFVNPLPEADAGADVNLCEGETTNLISYRRQQLFMEYWRNISKYNS